MPRPRPTVISLTEAAAARVRELVEAATRPSSASASASRTPAVPAWPIRSTRSRRRTPADDVVSEHGVSVFVDPKAMLFLLGTTMDFETTKLRSGFVFHNPNEVSSCGCGELVELKPAAGAGRDG